MKACIFERPLPVTLSFHATTSDGRSRWRKLHQRQSDSDRSEISLQWEWLQ